MKIFESIWYQGEKNLNYYLLLPVSWVFFIVTLVRRKLYQFKILKSIHFKVPVIVVGNLTVGGTGKTPLVIYLAKLFAEKGLKAGIVMRGYGAKCQQFPRLVLPESDPDQMGDEAVLIARETHCPVVIDPKRPVAIAKLLSEFSIDVVLSDDGLQHYKMARDIEIVVVDALRKFGNGQLLPAGPLRETTARLHTADYVIYNGGQNPADINMQTIPGEIYHLVNKRLLAKDHDRINAVAGIGHPERFFELLSAQGFDLIRHVFPDHHAYKAKDIQFDNVFPIVMTTKDAIKISAFANDRCYVMPITTELPANFDSSLLARVKLLQAKGD